MRQLMTLTRVEAALLLREPAAVLFTLALPLVLLALNGSQGNAPQAELGGVGLIDVMIPGFLVYVMATSAMMILPETLADYRDRGILRRLRISPLKPAHIIGSHAATHLVMIVAGILLLVGVAFVAYDLSMPSAWLPTVLAVSASAISIVAIGFLLGSVLPTVRTTQAVAAALFFPTIFVSGAMWPREALPEFAQRVGDVLPITYAVRAIREAWSAGAVDWAALGILAAVTVVAAGVAVRTFRWESR
jgi:ABC-2 type transport system permease protein